MVTWYSWVHIMGHMIFMSTRHRLHEYSWVGLQQVTGDMNIYEYTSRVTWIFMITRHWWHEYSWVHVTGDMNIHEYTSRVIYSWVHVTGDMNIQEFTSRVTWIFKSSRHGWHEYSWATSRMTEYSWAHITVDWIIMNTSHGWLSNREYTSRVTWKFLITRHGWHKYSWLHVTLDKNIHEEHPRHGRHEYS